jgi:hypothetical protein
MEIERPLLLIFSLFCIRVAFDLSKHQASRVLKANKVTLVRKIHFTLRALS